MAKSIKLTGELYIDSKGIVHNKQNLNDILNNITTIVDVTESQSGRYITSKISFDSPDVLCFILKTASDWSEEIFPVVIFDSNSTLLTVYGTWHNENTIYSYSALFERYRSNQLRIKKYAQINEITSYSWNEADDENYGAIRGDKIYAILKGKVK